MLRIERFISTALTRLFAGMAIVCLVCGFGNYIHFLFSAMAACVAYVNHKHG